MYWWFWWSGSKAPSRKLLLNKDDTTLWIILRFVWNIESHRFRECFIRLLTDTICWDLSFHKFGCRLFFTSISISVELAPSDASDPFESLTFWGKWSHLSSSAAWALSSNCLDVLKWATCPTDSICIKRLLKAIGFDLHLQQINLSWAF